MVTHNRPISQLGGSSRIHSRGGLNDRQLFLLSGGWRPEIMTSADFSPCEGSPPGLGTAPLLMEMTPKGKLWSPAS